MERTEIRQLDEVGRILLPREFRRALAWGNETKIAIQLDGSKWCCLRSPAYASFAPAKKIYAK